MLVIHYGGPDELRLIEEECPAEMARSASMSFSIAIRKGGAFETSGLPPSQSPFAFGRVDARDPAVCERHCQRGEPYVA